MQMSTEWWPLFEAGGVCKVNTAQGGKLNRNINKQEKKKPTLLDSEDLLLLDSGCATNSPRINPDPQ